MKEKTVYALGFFDGVHLGHAALLEQCHLLAQALHCPAGVVTFSDHPDTLVLGTAPGLINTVEDRQRLLREQFHMDEVVLLPFDRQMMQTSWEDFFHRLIHEFHAAGLVCGADFHFGRMGLGNADKLKAACERAGIPCTVVPQVTVQGVTVSSTHIRDLLEMGRMTKAVEFLGHPHILSGKVIPGHQLGRRLGIPTANLMLPKALAVPKFGVYACYCVIDGVRYAAVTNIGTRPTVAGIGITVEPWIQDYEGNLYGREITLEFYQFLRSEQAFSSLDALKEAILRDARKTKEILNRIPLAK